MRTLSLSTAVLFLLLISVCSTLFPSRLLAVEEVIEITQVGESTSIIPSVARAESLRQAIDKGGLATITNIIGAAKTEKNLDQIKQKVLTESTRYVQYYKASEPTKKDDKTTTITVTMKISTAALREILDQQGLLIQTDDVFEVLPLVKIQERRGQGRSYLWWRDDFTTAALVMKDEVKSFVHVSAATLGKGYKVIDPLATKLYQVVPEKYKHDELTVEEALSLGLDLKAQIILLGEAVVSPSDKPGKIKSMVRLTAYSTSNSRQLGDAIKTYELVQKKPQADLAIQQSLRSPFSDAAKSISSSLQEQFKKGTFGSQTVSIVVKGDVNYFDLENIKKEILLKIPEMRTLRERSMEKGRMAFEGDLVGSVNQLVRKLETVKFEKFELKVDNIAAGEVDLQWSKSRTGG